MVGEKAVRLLNYMNKSKEKGNMMRKKISKGFRFCEREIRYIRDNPEELTQQKLAEKFGVRQDFISKIINRKAYQMVV